MSEQFQVAETPRRVIRELSVEGSQRRKPSNHVVYSIKVLWSDGTINIIYRRFSEIMQLERNLRASFPRKKRSRIEIPSVQGKINFIPTTVHAKLERIRYFVLDLITLPKHISECELVTSFFTPRSEDLEIVKRKNPPRKKRKSKFSMKSSLLRRLSSKFLTANSIGEPVLLEQFVALENYQKKYLNDISLTKGYTVGVIEKHESGWWHVDCEGEIGWVPASFIKPVYGGDDDDDDIVTEIFAPGQEEIYMATRSYQAKQCDEISFDIGVNLSVIEKTLDGWWKVRYGHKEGWAPSVYLKRVGNASVFPAKSLRRLTAMGLQLRDDEMDGSLNGELQGGALPNGLMSNLNRSHSDSKVDHERSLEIREGSLIPNGWHSSVDIEKGNPGQGNGAHSVPLQISSEDPATQEIVSKGAHLNVSSSAEKSHEKSLSRCRSASVGDPRKVFSKNRQLMSELDLRLAEKRPGASARLLKRSRSCVFLCNVKNVIEQKIGLHDGSSRKISVESSIQLRSSEIETLEDFSKAKDYRERSLLSDLSIPTGDFLRHSVSNYELSTSATDVQPARPTVEVLRRVQSFRFSDNDKGIFEPSRGLDCHPTEKLLTAISTPGVVTESAEVKRSPSLAKNQKRSFSICQSLSTRDLRDALPNRGLSISELDLEIACKKEKERLELDQLRRNRSFSSSSNSKKANKSKTPLGKGFSEKKDAAKNTPPEILVALSPIFPRLGELSKRRLSGVSDATSSNSKAESSESLTGLKPFLGSKPLIFFTPPVSDTEEPLVSQSSNLAENESSEGSGLPNISSVLLRQGKEITEDRKLEERQISQTNEEETEVSHVTTKWFQEQLQQENHRQREQLQHSEENRDKNEKEKRQRLVYKVPLKKKQEPFRTYNSSETDDATYYAVATYEASGIGEVTGLEGDKVEVLAEHSSGWWMVRIDDRVGWFPSNFLLPAEQPEEEEEDGQHSVESDVDKENDDGDEDEDDEDDAGRNETWDEGKSKVWIHPVPRPTPHTNVYHQKREAAIRLPMLDHKSRCSLGAFDENCATTRPSPRARPKSSTDSSSSDESESLTYERKRNRSQIGAERVAISRNFQKESIGRSQRWSQRFKAMGCVGPSPRMPYFHHENDPVRRNVSSYDSGFLEEDGISVIRKMRNSVDSAFLPSAREGHYPNSTASRRSRSQDNEYNMKSYSKFRTRGRPSNRPYAYESTDDELFSVMGNHMANENSSSDDLSAFNTYTSQDRKGRKRLNPINSVVYNASNSHYKRHRRQIYQATASYQATTDSMIDLYEGDIVQVIRKSKGGWWLVEIHDELGWAPSNFLEPIMRCGKKTWAW